MFEDITFETIMDRMLDRIDDTFDKRESSPIYEALAPAALEISELYAALGDMFDEMFADTASREYLIRLAIARGLTPLPATNAVVQMDITPASLELEIGTQFTSSDTSYSVAGKLADGSYKMVCNDAGEVGSIYLGDVVPVEYVEGLETATITAILTYGEEEEDTEDFRERYMQSFVANEFGGNKTEYQNKTLDIAGVGAVKVIPVWNGAGTVKLVIVNSEYRRASTELIANVQVLFDPEQNGMGNGLAPIGHVVTVDSVEEITVGVSTELTFDTGYDWNSCQIAAETALESYFNGLRKSWDSQDAIVVRISSINTALLSVQGIVDVENTLLNGTGENLTLGTYQIPICGGVTNG